MLISDAFLAAFDWTSSQKSANLLMRKPPCWHALLACDRTLSDKLF